MHSIFSQYQVDVAELREQHVVAIQQRQRGFQFENQRSHRRQEQTADTQTTGTKREVHNLSSLSVSTR